MSKPLHCNEPMDPVGVLFSWIETENGVTIDPDGNDGGLVYEPTGWSEPLWETSVDIGYGCRECGHIVLNEGVVLEGTGLEVNA